MLLFDPVGSLIYDERAVLRSHFHALFGFLPVVAMTFPRSLESRQRRVNDWEQLMKRSIREGAGANLEEQSSGCSD